MISWFIKNYTTLKDGKGISDDTQNSIEKLRNDGEKIINDYKSKLGNLENDVVQY